MTYRDAYDWLILSKTNACSGGTIFYGRFAGANATASKALLATTAMPHPFLSRESKMPKNRWEREREKHRRLQKME